MIGGDGSPFDCEKCSDRDKEQRNCLNRLGLSDEARAVTEYTWAVVEELKNPLAYPPFINPPRPPFSKGGSKDRSSGGNRDAGSGGGRYGPPGGRRDNSLSVGKGPLSGGVGRLPESGDGLCEGEGKLGGCEGVPEKARSKGYAFRRAEQRPAQKVFSLGGIRLYECPVSYISRDTVEMMRLVYLVDDSKNLLHSGGWGDQPAWLVEAVEVFRMETVRRTGERKED